ncbi:MAG: winged helix DNA-binding domain-containing protein [Actinobacteria bacterium]|nr:winged helix DNA-binding domain-containing protein [Actinomycetota bacterium]
MNVPSLRLAGQRIASGRVATPEEAVAWMGAVQAQDRAMSLWAIGLRTDGCSEADVEAAVSAGRIVRTWTMRRTIHFAAAEDVHWMMALTRERVLRAYRKSLARLGLDEDDLATARRVVAKALEGGSRLTRPALYERLEAAGVPCGQSRGTHLMWRLGQEGITCFGPRDGKQPTMVLLDEWVTRRRDLAGDEALAEFASRYFRSHGPATAHDFAWWSGLTMGDARRAIAAAGLEEVSVGDETHYLDPSAVGAPVEGVYLLPAFDEYLVAYRGRAEVIEPAHLGRVNRGGGMFAPIVVVDGRVEGTWRRTVKRTTVEVAPEAFGRLEAQALEGIEAQAARFGEFLGVPAVVTAG